MYLSEMDHESNMYNTFSFSIDHTGNRLISFDDNLSQLCKLFGHIKCKLTIKPDGDREEGGVYSPDNILCKIYFNPISNNLIERMELGDDLMFEVTPIIKRVKICKYIYVTYEVSKSVPRKWWDRICVLADGSYDLETTRESEVPITGGEDNLLYKLDEEQNIITQYSNMVITITMSEVILHTNKLRHIARILEDY